MGHTRTIIFLLLALGWILGMTPGRAHAQVVVSIKPIHSLAAKIMEGSPMTPLLLVDGKQSLHDMALKPSQVEALQHAGLVLYIAPELETFLTPFLPKLAAQNRGQALASLTQHELLRARFVDLESHDDAHAHDAHHHAWDLHLWMSPLHARALVTAMTEALIKTYPEQAALFQSNARRLDQQLAALDQRLQERMRPLQTHGFAVFHDATQYFEARYGLNNQGAFALHPDAPLSAKRIQMLRQHIREKKLRCVFTEPTLPQEKQGRLLEGTAARSKPLDAEGQLLAPGPDLYFTLMEQTATAMENCLSPSPE